MTSSSTVGGIWPWATATLTSGTFLSRNSLTLGEILDARARHRRPGRRDSARAAAPRAPSTGSNGETKVRTASRSTGGVAMIDISRTPDSASCSVRGIGVAVSVSTCTSARSCFSFSLWLDAEMLLLVDDHQAEVLELDRLAEQRMGADDDVDLAVGEALLDLGELRRRDQARGLRDVDRKALEALGEGLEVLARQQRRRHHDRDLLAVHGGDEGGAQRHLGLAEADVAADQPVHRPAGAEIRRARRRSRPAGRRSPRRGSAAQNSS